MKLVVTVILLFLVGCAGQMQLKDPTVATRIWDALHPALTETALKASFSLQMETKERNARLLGLAWGYASSLVRLDLSSSAGANVAMIRETPSLWTAYLPSENKAYHHADARVGLDLFNIPVPCDARQVCKLLLGDFASVLPDEFDKVGSVRSGKIRYTFRSSDVEYLETDESMESIFIKGRSEWSLLCEKPSERTLPSGGKLFDKYTFTSGEDVAIMRIKSLQTGTIWQQADLDLKLPDTVQWMRLDPDAQHTIN